MNQITIADQNFSILELPGRPPAMLDRDVALLYEVTTREINQAAKNNPGKFPSDFCFVVTDSELQDLKSKIVTSNPRAFNRGNPSLFTLEGCNMLATIIKSTTAVKRAVQIIKGFTMVERGDVQIESIDQSKMLPTTKAKNIIKDGLEVAALFNVPRHLAEVEAVKQARTITGVDYTPLLLASPAQSQIAEEEKSLEPADIGKALGLKGTPQKIGRAINGFLCEAGLQIKTSAGWVPTDEGAHLASRHQWSKGDKTGYNYKWNLAKVRDLWQG